MREHRATRTLVKSAPELWLTCSEESLLARHLESFGDIRVTRLEPESTVAWEGEAASGTVLIEPSGWGTRVTLTASIRELAGREGEDAKPAPGLSAIWARLLDHVWRRPPLRASAVAPTDSAQRSEVGAHPGGPATEPDGAPRKFDAERALAAALDSLGRAHHRPFSR